jgi:hypothetical protein
MRGRGTELGLKRAGLVVVGGTLCSASLVVERRPLIALSMPRFKAMIGID